MKLYNRWQEFSIKKALKNSRVVILSGARQCGKTTLAKIVLPQNSIYKTLDDFSQRNFANSDPNGFLKKTQKTMIIDEIQKAPELISSIKKIVDDNNNNGQFLITGSSNIQANPAVKESLAGRVEKIRLRAFSQGELNQKKPKFLPNAFKSNFIENKTNYTRDDLIQLALSGGYPTTFNKNIKEKKIWYLNYINTLIENDLKDIANIKRQSALKDLLKIIASWSSKYMEKNAILSSLAITKQTFDTYISIFESMYLTERLCPYLTSDYQYITKKDKLYICDTGIMASLLNLNIDRVRENSDTIGKLIETFVFNELSSNIDCFFGEYNFYHYRDKDKREIDFIIENSDDALLGIEVKAGINIDISSFKHLKWFKENIAKNKNFIGIILYTGNDIISYKNNFFAVPISSMWG